MKRLTFVLCAALLALAFTTGTAMAADVTGKWTATMAGRGGGGEGFTITYNFKQDGTKLTGTVEGPMGDPMQIADGKVDGDKLSFTISFEGGPNGAMKITNEGTISGDEIKLTTKFEGGDFGGGDRPPATLKRVK
jgi:hypothetical protein